MKIYAISIMAMSQHHEIAPENGTAVMHIPALQPAESIEQAAEIAKAKAFELWPTKDMWYGHQAALVSVTDAFYSASKEAERVGVIEWGAPTEERVFQFDDDVLDAECLDS